MRDRAVSRDWLLLFAIALIATIAVAGFSHISLRTYGPYASIGREVGTALLLVEGEPRIDLNSASAELLQTLDGIGPTLADRIVAFRGEHGPFQSIEELMLVQGIGEKKFEANRDRIAVEQDSTVLPGE